ncbi:MAG: acyl CoA:acetate/3-ketoacid CoA transferase [Fusobacterium sp.]|nr:acyl CoA:acetate/3-ketoacid CoA transferase [Fusobacterium sp.]
MKVVNSNEIAKIIKNNSFIAIDGFVGIGVPEEILLKIEKSFLEKGSPHSLSVIFAAGFGDGKTKGLNRIAHEGLIKKAIGGHWGLAPNLGKLAIENKIEAYNLPQGVIAQMFRNMAANKPGIISRVGLGTFVDPDLEGGKLNSITKEEIVSKINILGEELLFYKSPKLDYAILRGTSSDEDGNISCENEALLLEGIHIASATKNAGGKVIVQVEKIVKKGSILPKEVRIPGILVDYVVVVEDIKNHMQTFGEQYNYGYTNNNALFSDNAISFPLDERKIIARRCAMNLRKESKVLNYGIGMPESIALVLKEENQNMNFTPTVEPGAIGGIPMGGLSFGASFNPICILEQPTQFDFYDGGGLDMAFLGLAQCDQYGNINVSKFGSKLAGCGGFINITQNAKEVIFCGTFTAGGLEIAVENGKLKIIKEGKTKKFMKNVEQITFSADLAKNNNKKVLYITERAVFELRKEGLTLIEIANGVDLEKDILANMEFKPLFAKEIKFMNKEIFLDKPMGLIF